MAGVDALVEAVLAELRGRERDQQGPVIDLPDPHAAEPGAASGVEQPLDAGGMANLCAATSARIGVGRAGPRLRTATLLRFQADHAVARDAIHGTASEAVKQGLELFTVRTLAHDRATYLLRPDLGRRLGDEARRTIAERCAPNPQVQIVIGDGLSATAVDHNVTEIYPVIEQGLRAAGITIGTPFFVENARVGVINDIGEVVGADVVVILIGERPGLGIADALSAYLGWRPRPGKTDAHRDLVCMITDDGGTNPLEAGAYVVELIRRTLLHRASGVELRRALAGGPPPPDDEAGGPPQSVETAVRAALRERLGELPQDVDAVIARVAGQMA